MPSPFPGMNPFFELPSVWHDFRQRFMTAAADVIGSQVLPRYFVRIDEHVYVHELDEGPRRLRGRGDVLVSTLSPGQGGTAATTLEAPAEVQSVPFDVESEPFLEIRDRNRRELVTVVELLSPSNKYAGPDREQYLAKCRQVLRSNAHLVEIDLLRGGPRMPWQGMPACDYCVVVSRAEQRPRAGIWPVGLRERLPEVPIPLRGGDADARLDLQALLHRVYDAAGYGYYMYEEQPEPALREEDAAWARALIAGAGG